MSTYPDFPDNRLIVNGVDLSVNFRLALLDGYTLSPPEPKLYTVDIPGGNGKIDLTEALSGDVTYSNRQQTFEFAVIFPEDYQVIKTKLSNFLHGKEYDYVMTMDPEYTYHGRFTIEEYSHTAYAEGIVGFITIKIDANPFKKKETMTYKLNAAGGKWYHFPSGRKPVRPIIETKQATKIFWKDKPVQLGVGTFRLNDVLFTEGINDLYINTFEIFDTLYMDIEADGKHQMTWEEAKDYTWDEIQRIDIEGNVTTYTWNDFSTTTYGEFTADEKTWYDVDYKPDASDSAAYVQYDWSDL